MAGWVEFPNNSNNSNNFQKFQHFQFFQFLFSKFFSILFLKICSGSCGTKRGRLRASHAPAGAKPLAIRRMSSGPPRTGGLRCSCASPRPMRRDGDLIPFSMTIGLLPISTRIVASLALKSSSSHLPSVAVLRVGGFGHLNKKNKKTREIRYSGS